MNKQQKEVQQVLLNNEKEVLKKLKDNYQDALDEINSKIEILMARQDADMQHVIYQVEYQKALKKQVQGILDTLQANEFETVSEYLAKSYEDGFIGTMYDLQGQGVPLVVPIDQEQVVAAIQHETKLSEDLYTSLGKDIKDLQRKISGEISRGISGGHMYSEIARNIAAYAVISRNRAMTISRTEGHRIQCKATSDAQFKAKDKGADIVKQWDAALDRKTRPTHRKLDGQIRELEEEFEVAGHKAMMPGGFNIAGEDINCRCALLQRARWALGHDYTKWSEDAPVVIDDDGTTQYVMLEAKNYKQFKERYQERVRGGTQMTKPTNKNGDEITFDLESAKGDKWARSKERREKGKEFITQLANEYNSNLTSVVAGAKGVAGEVGLDGVMRLSNFKHDTLTHEFAHAMASSSRVKYGLADETEKAFMKELAKIRRKYMDEQHGNPKKGIKAKPEINISPYANSDIDEFFAEAFTQAKLLQLGYELPKGFGTDTKYSMQVLELVDKYFKKDVLENTVKSSTIEMYRKGSTFRKTSEQGKKIIDKATYNKITKPAIKNGADIRIAEGEYLEHIKKQGTAVTLGDVIYFTPEATVSDVLEEVYHFNQNRLGINAQYSSKQREIMNEIEAKKYLLSVTEKYNIPNEEVEETKAHLVSYTKQMEEMKERGEWDD